MQRRNNLPYTDIVKRSTAYIPFPSRREQPFSFADCARTRTRLAVANQLKGILPLSLLPSSPHMIDHAVVNLLLLVEPQNKFTRENCTVTIICMGILNYIFYGSLTICEKRCCDMGMIFCWLIQPQFRRLARVD